MIMDGLIRNYSLSVKIFENRDLLGKSAAEDAGLYIRKLLNKQEEVNLIFAAAPSQNEFLKYLKLQDVNWNRINAFHMDEYMGLEKGDSRLFSSFLKMSIFDKVPFKKVHYIENGEESVDSKIRRYQELLSQYPVDITFMGIGENGHIAFNDPHVADFNDSQMIKVVDLDEKCRLQQVHDGCFKCIDEVPKFAITLTIPALMKAKKVFCMVPSITKAEAVKKTIFGDISETCPATIIRRHRDSVLYLDKDSGKYLL
ncbi:MAG: glucosamine-6-phosphate deaminase [Clostridiales bacterium]|nr:glucosamine-6-phosphate deaminase [Clostridiales bacterium]